MGKAPIFNNIENTYWMTNQLVNSCKRVGVAKLLNTLHSASVQPGDSKRAVDVI